ncbi:MAG TPA: hypothetical protein EYO61_03895, partial [Campylobacterales bacterium]|nr:hypothetical protein [Campylobacterales bacterium]
MDKTNIDDVYLEMISKEAEKIATKFAEQKQLTDSEIHTLVLKTQYNHINHLDKKLDEVTQSVKNLEHKFERLEETTDRRLSELEEKTDRRISELEEKTDRRISELEAKMEKEVALLRENIKTEIHKAISTQTKWFVGGAGVLVVLLKL